MELTAKELTNVRRAVDGLYGLIPRLEQAIMERRKGTILFSDLLVPLAPMGLPFDFHKGEGPVVEKGITVKDYAESRIEVIVGCVVMVVVAFFIVVACAAAIWQKGPREIASAAEAAEALRPFGEYAYLLFCAGLLNASLFAASILPLSTAYSVCEGLGFESGVSLPRMPSIPFTSWAICSR